MRPLSLPQGMALPAFTNALESKSPLQQKSEALSLNFWVFLWSEMVKAIRLHLDLLQAHTRKIYGLPKK